MVYPLHNNLLSHYQQEYGSKKSASALVNPDKHKKLPQKEGTFCLHFGAFYDLEGLGAELDNYRSRNSFLSLSNKIISIIKLLEETGIMALPIDQLLIPLAPIIISFNPFFPKLNCKASRTQQPLSFLEYNRLPCEELHPSPNKRIYSLKYLEGAFLLTGFPVCSKMSTKQIGLPD
ncbi:hypothetical protein JOC76_002904 [Neobacillus cucumis]|uniref:hypothetical protein n=1 Tax=Neobacillus cucumis TaxID=1740721 RepID=UPI001FDD1732|nr:hypothetical protein [Neobacillus cucumis]